MDKTILTLDDKTYCIDGYDLHMPERTGCYVIDERPSGSVAIIETGPSLSVPHLKKGLNKLNIGLEEIKYIIVTHIHLDHAGGAGLLLQDCPNATVIVHPRGLQHLNDPSRLINGAKAVYGEAFYDLFDPIVPIPLDSLKIMNHLDQLPLSDKRTLTFYDTPGHSKHHFSIFDSNSEIFFTGDTIGIRYPEIDRREIPFYIPSTSPNQFDPDAMLQSLQLVEEVKPKQIAFGHYGASKKPQVVFAQIRKWLPVFVEKAEQVYNNNQDFNELNDVLMDEIKKYLADFGVEDDDFVYNSIQLDVRISAMGIFDYLHKR